MSDGDISESLSRAADRSSPCARVLRHHEGRAVATHASDFYQALKTIDPLVIRISDASIADLPACADYRFTGNYIDYTVGGDAQPSLTGRNQFVKAVRSAEDVELLHREESWFVESEEVRCDRGGA